MFELQEIRLIKRQSVFTFLVFVFIFLLGFFAGKSIPDYRYEAVYNYAVLLEEENCRLNNNLESCN